MTNEHITQMANDLFHEERARTRLDGWFFIKQLQRRCHEEFAHLPPQQRAAETLKVVARELPLSISKNAMFAGTQRDAFARSYALINPAFEVESFAGYCDPTAVFGDITPGEGITQEEIDDARRYEKQGAYAKALGEVYADVENLTGEVVFFVEQVTGHLIPDFRPMLEHGVVAFAEKVQNPALKAALEAATILAGRYAEIARKQGQGKLAQVLERVPRHGARTLREALQSYMLLWQVMCLEQAPNPFAFSVGNADRIFEPYRAAENLDRESAAALFKHLLVFYNVGDRSWAISQNLIIGGKDIDGSDLTNTASFALLDAYYDMNLPQPILSVKLHQNTPDELYQSLGRFFFTPGVLTPSLFNDDAMFQVLARAGVEEADLPDYSIAGCQEPLIMGRDNANTTNSWLNLAKILELCLNNGKSLITSKQIAEPVGADANPPEALSNIRKTFYAAVEKYAAIMANAANGCSRALSQLPVPFLSAAMHCDEIDMRDPNKQGTKYNGSGCLIHGLAVVADSFVAIDQLLAERPEDADKLITALQNDFTGYEDLQTFLLAAPKFGNHIEIADKEAADVASRVADIVAAQKNYLGNAFRPDFSTPSTHLLYGYWVGATPDGRKARTQLNYGTDPLHGDANQGMGLRTLSSFTLPYEKLTGGYASHYGIDPKYFADAKTHEDKGLAFAKRVVAPLFFNEANAEKVSPFYLYVNVTTPETLRKVLANPKKYAPSGVYVMRIHGTFVNFLDLSPAIQQDIIARLDLESTRL
ncbi:MAG: hypothetical protein FWD06_02090 [Oscillospiraceae bacterium]|nr:hypothetical protein [Oscillospiraceae bacterium]